MRPTLPQPPYPLMTDIIASGSKFDTAIQPYGVILHSNVTPEAPRIDGTFRITWNYIMQIFNYPTTFELPEYVRWPENPMVLNPGGEPWKLLGKRKYKSMPTPGPQAVKWQ